ncbi:hypothetical protein Hanom_Chr09g00871611 [Helianthus anomalus]
MMMFLGSKSYGIDVIRRGMSRKARNGQTYDPHHYAFPRLLVLFPVCHSHYHASR